MNKIARIIVIVVALVSMKSAFAQMGAAQKVVWDVTKVTTIPADQMSVWELLSNPKNMEFYTKGFIKSVEIKGTGLPLERIITFENGTTRTEEINQIEMQHKFMSYQLVGESLPKGLEDVSIAVFTKEKGETTEVSWMAMVLGNDKEAKKMLTDQLKVEFEKYAVGLTNLFKNAVPAAKMQ